MRMVEQLMRPVRSVRLVMLERQLNQLIGRKMWKKLTVKVYADTFLLCHCGGINEIMSMISTRNDIHEVLFYTWGCNQYGSLLRS